MQIVPTKKQDSFLFSDKKFNAILGGIGSGKSWAGAVKTYLKITEEPGVTGFIGANTYRQLNNATLQTLFTLFDDLNIPFKYNQNKGIVHVMNTDIICASMDNYDVHRGIQIGWFWLDESRDTKKAAFDMIMGRLRHPKGKQLEGWVTTSPNGFDWVYDYFSGEMKTDNFEMFNVTSYDNPHLPDDYIENLKAVYTDRMFEQEVMGQFVNMTQGRIYYSFERSKHVRSIEINPRFPIMLGMDFNVNPMTSVAFQHYDNKFWVIDEFWLMTSNTGEMAQVIKERYGQGLVIYPDSTGRALKTSAAGVSDHEILRRQGFRVQSNHNPFRGDRYNAVNNVLEKQRLVIDPKCKKLIKDLEQVSYKDGTNLPDTTKDATLTHISDALGYPVYAIEPIARPRLAPGAMPR